MEEPIELTASARSFIIINLSASNAGSWGVFVAYVQVAPGTTDFAHGHRVSVRYDGGPAYATLTIPIKDGEKCTMSWESMSAASSPTVDSIVEVGFD